MVYTPQMVDGWEDVDELTMRMKVSGRWLIRDLNLTCTSVPLCLVPDPQYQWTLKE